VLISISFSTVGWMSAGAIIQPSRQPVIAQDLEKLLMTMTLSSGSTRSRTEGAAQRS
jgi:hypothetical protein